MASQSEIMGRVLDRLEGEDLGGTLRARFSEKARVLSARVVGRGIIQSEGQYYNSVGDLGAEGDVVQVVNVGRPGAALYASASGGTVVAAAGGDGGGGGGGGGGMVPHDYATYHTGTIPDLHAPQFLLATGARPLTGNLSVGVGITIDGVDLSAHAADVDAHHSRSHVLATNLALGPYQTVSGLTAGQVLRASAAGAANFQRLDYADLVYAGGGAALDVFGLGAANTPALLTPSADVSAGGNAVLRSNAGAVTVNLLTAAGTNAKVRTPTIDTVSGDLALAPATGITGLSNLQASGYVRTPTLTAAADLTLSPTGDVILTPGSGAWVQLTDGKSLRTATFNSGFAGNGFRIDQGVSEAARTTLEVDNVWVRGRMHIYEMLIHQIRATNGSLFVSSTGKVTVVSGAGPYTMTTDPAHGFAVGDLLRAQRWDAASSTVYQSNMQVTVVTDTTHFAATLSSGNAPAVGFEYVRLGSVSDTNRRGGIYLTADDSGAPFIDVFDGVNTFATWGTAGVIKTRLGKLDGLALGGGYTGEYGLYAGNGTTDNDAYLRLSNKTNRLNNLPMEWWSGASKLISISSANGINLHATSAYSYPRSLTFVDPTSDPIAELSAWQGGSGAENYVRLLAYGDVEQTVGSVDIRAENGAIGTTQTVTLEASAGLYTPARVRLTSENVGAPSSLIELSAQTITLYGTTAVSGPFSTGIATLGQTVNSNEILRLNGERAWAFGMFGSGGASEMHLYPVVDSKYFRITDQADTVDVLSVFAAATGATVGITAPLTVTGNSSITGALNVGGAIDATGAIVTDGSLTVDGGPAGLGQLAASSLQLGNTRSVAGSAFIDLVADAATYTDYGMRLIRLSTNTPNGDSQIMHKGTGKLHLVSVEAGSIELGTANTTRLVIDSTGLVGVNVTPTSRFHVAGNARANGFYADAEAGGVAGTVGLSNGSNVAANSTGVGTIKMKGTTSRDSAGFIKIYIGTTIYWVPVFAAITG